MPKYSVVKVEANVHAAELVLIMESAKAKCNCYTISNIKKIKFQSFVQNDSVPFIHDGRTRELYFNILIPTQKHEKTILKPIFQIEVGCRYSDSKKRCGAFEMVKLKNIKTFVTKTQLNTFMIRWFAF